MTKARIDEWNLIKINAYYLLRKDGKAEKIFKQYIKDTNTVIAKIRKYAKKLLPSVKCDMVINLDRGFVGFAVKNEQDLPEGWRFANSRFEFRHTNSGGLMIYPHQGKKGGRALGKAIYGKDMPKVLSSNELVMKLGFGYSKVFCGMGSYSGCGYKMDKDRIVISVALFQDEDGKFFHQKTRKMLKK